MLSIQQLIKALRAFQNGACCYSDLTKNLQYISMTSADTISAATLTSILSKILDKHAQALANIDEKSEAASSSKQQLAANCENNKSSQETADDERNSHTGNFSLISHFNEYGLFQAESEQQNQQQKTNQHFKSVSATQDSHTTAIATNNAHLLRSQRIQTFYQQQLHHFHTQHISGLCTKQKQTYFAMSSLAAEPLTLKQDDYIAANNSNGSDCQQPSGTSCNDTTVSSAASASGKPCFTAGLAEILQFMELIGNLKHTKRTGWVLRDVNDCESISGHMYRMSMMTFLLDGSEGLNQIRCMELALVHDLAESLVGDITPFCGISKQDKRAMEFKAMEDICKLIEPRGKRIMELFEEYELAESAESKFVKDLDRLDMVMQAFEYEKRDNCLLKHQEFFDSTEGKFNHPFVKKLVNEIYEQRKSLATAKGATPPPALEVPDVSELPSSNECTSTSLQPPQDTHNLSSTSS